MADDAVKLWRKKFGNTHINLYSILTKLHADNPNDTTLFVMDVIEPEELSCLKDQFVNLDELKEDVKMKMNVCWRRKDTQIETDPCVIQDVIELPESEYARFYQNLLDDYDFIAEHQDAMFYKDGQ